MGGGASSRAPVRQFQLPSLWVNDQRERDRRIATLDTIQSPCFCLRCCAAMLHTRTPAKLMPDKMRAEEPNTGQVADSLRSRPASPTTKPRLCPAATHLN